MHISRAARDIEYRDDVAAVEASALVVERDVEELEDVVNFHEDAEDLVDVVGFENAVAVAELNNVFDAAVAEKIAED